ncbi:FeoA family protein [Martelella alba]|uniref:Ferrous iron transport protein A n=1 Tax=Martelella alba TaxID=2590451 RepID=A0ABY2SPJ0_9HYPH|nr:FeoA family protein [Martelella alba]TKI06578.1 ferrous iron transport protein A [Martelella alba]
MFLHELAPTDEGRVVGFSKGASDYRRRLLALGVTPGAPFKVTRVAPLGDPMEIRVRGSSISVRKEEARILLVEKISPEKL